MMSQQSMAQAADLLHALKQGQSSKQAQSGIPYGMSVHNGYNRGFGMPLQNNGYRAPTAMNTMQMNNMQQPMMPNMQQVRSVPQIPQAPTQISQQQGGSHGNMLMTNGQIPPPQQLNQQHSAPIDA